MSTNTFSKSAIIPVLLACAAMIIAGPACGRKHSVQAQITGTGAGHEITADADAGGRIIEHNTRTYVQLGSHALEVQPEHLLLDGKEAAAIPPAVKLEITLSKNTLTVNADGKQVFTTTVTP